MTFRPELAHEMFPDSVQIFKAATTDEDPVNAKILKLIIDMGLSLTNRKTERELRILKMKNNDHFKQITMFQKTLTILESHHFALTARQYVLDLFDKGVMRRIVLEEEAEEETESDTG